MYGDASTQSARSLTADEISSFLWRHPLVALDVTIGTVSPSGETVEDDTLAGWVTVFNDNLGTEYVLTNYDPDTDNIYSILGSSVASGVGEIASTAATAAQEVGTAALGTINYLPMLLLAAGALFLWSNFSGKKS